MAARLLDRDFRYTPAVKTDLRKTFARLRRHAREAAAAAEAKAAEDAAAQAAEDAATAAKVKPLLRGRK